MRFRRPRPGYNRSGERVVDERDAPVDERDAVVGGRGGIVVRLFGGLDEQAGRGETVEAEPSVGTVGDLVAGLALPPSAVGLILVNGLHAGLSSPLTAGDEVALFPPVGGG
jgi:molybdopterin synthase sulfur carrier subunit